MSAPKTDLKDQEKKHKTPLTGMAWMVGFAAVLLIGLVLYLSTSGNEPGNDEPIQSDQAGADAVADPGAAGDETAPSAATEEGSTPAQ